jgi:hypothetical protein
MPRLPFFNGPLTGDAVAYSPVNHNPGGLLETLSGPISKAIGGLFYNPANDPAAQQAHLYASQADAVRQKAALEGKQASAMSALGAQLAQMTPEQQAAALTQMAGMTVDPNTSPIASAMTGAPDMSMGTGPTPSGITQDPQTYQVQAAQSPISQAVSAVPPPPPGPVPTEEEAQAFIRQRFPNAHITSGYRSPEHNADIGGAPNSYHTRGKGEALDVTGVPVSSLRQAISEQGYPATELMAEGAHSKHSTGNHVHWAFGGATKAASPIAAAMAPQEPQTTTLTDQVPSGVSMAPPSIGEAVDVNNPSVGGAITMTADSMSKGLMAAYTSAISAGGDPVLTMRALEGFAATMGPTGEDALARLRFATDGTALGKDDSLSVSDQTKLRDQNDALARYGFDQKAMTAQAVADTNAASRTTVANIHQDTAETVAAGHDSTSRRNTDAHVSTSQRGQDIHHGDTTRGQDLEHEDRVAATAQRGAPTHRVVTTTRTRTKGSQPAPPPTTGPAPVSHGTARSHVSSMSDDQLRRSLGL